MRKSLIEELNRCKEDYNLLETELDDAYRVAGIKFGYDSFNIRLKELREDLIYKVSQERAAEILGIKQFEDLNATMGREAYKAYLEEAERLYSLRPWKDIVKKIQYDQMIYIMTKSDGGEIGQLQQLVSRGAIIFADKAETELEALHLKYVDSITETQPLDENEKYSIFTS
jgi:hypothetical protein